jgi:GMP synthase-like glutamine amidotransferase
MVKRALVVTHVEHEGPGRLRRLLERRGYELEACEPYRGQKLPDDLEPSAVVIVMGGPMGVADQNLPEFEFLQREIEFLRRRIDQGGGVLGICLGAQLLAAAAGAPVKQMARTDGQRAYEVGWSLLRFHPRDAADPLLRGVPRETPMLHWHGDTFDLPTGARRIASTEACLNQAFSLRDRQVGLQFHCEVTAPMIEDFIREDGPYAVQANGEDAIDRLRDDTRRYIEGLERIGDRLLENTLEMIA